MTVALSRGADRAILTALGAMASLTAQDVPAALLARARHVHISSYFLLEHSLGPGLAAMLAAARAAGATTSLDTNWDPAGKWGDGQLHASLAQTDVLLPNETEAVRIAGEPTLPAAAAALTAAGPRLAVKLGERGVLCADGPVWHRVELPPVTPVDTTGAGDCFNAGLIAGPAARPRPARRGRAGLCRWRAVDPGARRHGELPGPGLRPGPGPDRHRPEGQRRDAVPVVTAGRPSARWVPRVRARSSAFSGCRPPFIRSVKISAAAASG